MGNYFIAIAGSIGVGKSTLTTLLAERLGWQPVLEAFDENPYLADFYQDMRRWSFHSQIFFLSRRVERHHRLLHNGSSVIQDRSVYEDANIFAYNLYRQGQMAARDWQTYAELARTLIDLLHPPDLIVYLRASVPTLLQRIAQRGRSYEQDIAPDYLAQLNELYDAWAADFRLCPVLEIATDELNYITCREHLDYVAQCIAERLHDDQRRGAAALAV
jgi:deoxyadenosine/deoxycytidine kinase